MADAIRATGDGVQLTILEGSPPAQVSAGAIALVPTSAPVRRPLGAAGLRVLCAEDHPVNRLVIAALLELRGVIPVVVDNGALALEAWEAAWADEPWHAILTDIQMPVMDGVALTRQIRRREHQTGRERTAILAVTGNILPADVAGYLAAGMDGVVAKPLNAAQLHAALHDALAAAQPRRLSTV